MRFLLTLSLALALQLPATAGVRVLIARLPLAGSQYYALAEVWPELRVGAPLELLREADNRHDERAIRVVWRGRQIGYLPRAANRALAAALDRGTRLRGRIAALAADADPWRRLELEVYAEL